MIATLRTLTRKSKVGIGYGRVKDMTVQEFFDFNKESYLVSCYFNYTSINFTEDILIDLKITEEYRILKPSMSEDVYNLFLENNASESRDYGMGADKLRIKSKPIKKSKLQSRNHNH